MSNRLDQWFARNERAEQLEEEGRFDEALELYEANISEGCTISFTYDRAALIYRRFERRADELEALRRAVELEEKRGPSRRLVKLQERYEISSEVAQRETVKKAAAPRASRRAPASAPRARRQKEAEGCFKSFLLIVLATGMGGFFVLATMV